MGILHSFQLQGVHDTGGHGQGPSPTCYRFGSKPTDRLLPHPSVGGPREPLAATPTKRRDRLYLRTTTTHDKANVQYIQY